MKKTVALLGVIAFLSGCGILYTNVEEPYSYRSASPIDIKATAADEIVTGESCNQSVLFLVSWGRGGYAAAASNALEGRPGTILYDVKADIKVKAYLLGLYTEHCTVVTGKVGKP